MARITGVPARKAGLLARLGYWLARRKVGMVPEPLTIAARHPQIFRAYAGYEYSLGKARLLPEQLKSLASLRAAALIGCPF